MPSVTSDKYIQFDGIKFYLPQVSTKSSPKISGYALSQMIYDFDRKYETSGYLLGKYDASAGAPQFYRYLPMKGLKRLRDSVEVKNGNKELRQLKRLKKKGYTSIIRVHVHPDQDYTKFADNEPGYTDSSAFVGFDSYAKAIGFQEVYSGIQFGGSRLKSSKGLNLYHLTGIGLEKTSYEVVNFDQSKIYKDKKLRKFARSTQGVKHAFSEFRYVTTTDVNKYHFEPGYYKNVLSLKVLKKEVNEMLLNKGIKNIKLKGKRSDLYLKEVVKPYMKLRRGYNPDLLYIIGEQLKSSMANYKSGNLSINI
ncbi:hypothetical protein Mia14_0332 [Candidatus Mancarchaeum acidiphilum]|uniref:Uncharacterized protein n=1 Tax=Candidatus Mancarchaeum acidiphilum TaxID=1920749 RepID=A0A218NMG2_9ARCH|nr:hypothetical protein [Candidatus Mancarchaeum acidiphilum]ASI13658.1 hypothetical protein Mia14_0332 [Candidatus Mancarchaeum acidiphilum]